jgi:outer membrane protein assembly factor BamA
MKVLLSTLVLALAAGSALAQPDPSVEGRTILAIRMSGLDRVKASVVLAQMESAAGQSYHQSTADRDVVRLERLGVFAVIALTPVTVDAGVRLDVTVTETPRIAGGVALAVTDENGISLGPALKMTSLAGRPVDVGVITRFGGETLVSFQETAPYETHRRLWHSAALSLSDRTTDLAQFEERSIDLDARIGAHFSEHWRSGAVFTFYGVTSDVSGITLSPDNHDSFESIGGITEYDSRNSFRQPSRGWFNSVDGLWTTGSGRYATLDVDVSRYQPVAARQQVVATALLTLRSGVNGVDLPAYADYALGGENTVRGRPFAEKRGKNQFISTIEYRYTALPARSFRVFGANWYGGLALAVFTDVGSAWDHSYGFSDGLICGGGVGLRLYVPYVSMVRFDLAVGSSLHGGFGIGEKTVAQRNRVR